MENTNHRFKEIYLAGGCFWGVERYMKNVYGVVKTESGYANGNTENPTYEQVCYFGTNHAETVKVIYDTSKADLSFILYMYFKIIDPTLVDQQGPDIGPQYRTGIYFTDSSDEETIRKALKELKKSYPHDLIVVECLPLSNFYKAEEYHQDYLDKNPGGYCHISWNDMKKAFHTYPVLDFAMELKKPDDKKIRELLNPIQFDVTQNSATEPPFDNEYNDFFEEGIYTDILTGEPLFSSKDKFACSCGWPSFYRPIDNRCIVLRGDTSFGMVRTEVLARVSGSHLGHVFNDIDSDGHTQRYCINSAALKFIPSNKLSENGYNELNKLF
ncbi:peptide-methionine (S)-S-oxide reductase MsrA [Lachnospiraceae bacterium NSJ-143]|nr:peptide-methionine (S)-S-oxide reductase MsrA [Lachnospiraceae bacterium NSJ-143]